MDEMMVEHNEKHCKELSAKCPFCSLRRIADALELIAMVVHKHMKESEGLEAMQ